MKYNEIITSLEKFCAQFRRIQAISIAIGELVNLDWRNFHQAIGETFILLFPWKWSKKAWWKFHCSCSKLFQSKIQKKSETSFLGREQRISQTRSQNTPTLRLRFAFKYKYNALSNGSKAFLQLVHRCKSRNGGNDACNDWQHTPRARAASWHG